MRPINLIPERERRAQGGSGRTGPLAYIVVGALAVLLIGVVTMVLTSNQISDREDEVISLEAEKAAASAEAAALTPYVNFAAVAGQRIQTVAGLADSRFDWARVVRQLSLILPPTIYVIGVDGSAGGGATEGPGGGIAGPSLSIKGCAPGQDAVAGFVAALKQIDGVTRVGLSISELEDDSGGGGDAEADCRGTFAFALTVAFDEAPPSPDSGSFVAEAPIEGEAAPEGEAPVEGEAPAEGEPAPEGEAAATGAASASTASGAEG
jgi:Tfp pilus assembly protein PilN